MLALFLAANRGQEGKAAKLKVGSFPINSITQNSSVAASIVRKTGPVAGPRERQFDLASRINGLIYRLIISAPVNVEPNRVSPVLYVLDGNCYFRAASDPATWGSGLFEPTIIVGISYPPEEDAEVHRQRSIDMTVKADPVMFPNGSGRCDEFLRAIEDQVKPFVASRYPVDPVRQMLYGKSLGGLHRGAHPAPQPDPLQHLHRGKSLDLAGRQGGAR